MKDRHLLNEEDRKKFLKHHFVPAPKYRFPRHYDEKSRKSRGFRAEWFDQFTWFVYSKSLDGEFCMPCVLFATKASVWRCSFGCLVETPFQDFKKALGKNGVIVTHEQKDYHNVSMLRISSFKEHERNAASRIDVQMLQRQESEFSFNKAALESIADCLVYCGKQGIALRGHLDDSTANESTCTNKGNFKALLQMYATKDKVMQKFIESCPANALYTSKTIQNELISLISGIIRQQIIQNLSVTCL